MNQDDQSLPPKKPELPRSPSPSSNGDGSSASADDVSYDPQSWVGIGCQLFQWRDYTPIPLVLLVLLFTEATAMSATLGTLVILVGELMRIYGVAFIGSVSRTRSESTGSRIIQRGPYALVRNPLYVANITIATGFAIYAGVGWILVLTVLLAIGQYYAIAQYEEVLLERKFGKEYRDYRDRVPAWIPRRKPSPETMDWAGDYRAALISERSSLTAIVLLLLALMVLS